MRSYKVENVSRASGDSFVWRVVFFLDGEEFGRGHFDSADEADAAGVDFLFGGG